MSVDPQIVVTARALLVVRDCLLLVTNDESYWYTPGGHLTPGESLQQCAARELFEESGLVATAGRLLHVAEFVERETNEHKVECYFLMDAVKDDLPDGWMDSGPVRKCRFFSITELRSGLRVHPQFLLEATWLGSAQPAYQGLERR